ncbi:MAG: HEAT repeat domain-containing protein [Sedimentisphaerales bacterium]|nr:HEAT repeat domain-containing protein [Sedimentisphaerales bacterium]
MEQQIEALKTTYDWGQSRVPLTELSDHIRASFGNETELKNIRTALLSVLDSDAKYAAKQYVCRELSIIGNDDCVPALAKLLTDEKLSDMARYALERIPGPAVDKALLAALPRAEGKAKIGIVNTLGNRACRDAVSETAKLARSSDEALACAAVSALGKMGGAEAANALAQVADGVSEKVKPALYDARLTCADRMVAEGDRAGARKIYQSLTATGVPQLVRTAALRGMRDAVSSR